MYTPFTGTSASVETLMTLSTGVSGSTHTALSTSSSVASVTERTGTSSSAGFSTLTGLTSGITQSSSSSGTSTGTTTKRCEEMQAVDETTSKQIIVSPVDIAQQDKPKFQPTSPEGVSFPENETTPTITVNFGKPAAVQSVTIPRDKISGANVQQFAVTFYSSDGKKINDKPIESNTSPKDDNTKPAQVDSSQTPSSTPVSRVEITIISTTDNKSPKGVTLDVKACTKSTTG